MKRTRDRWKVSDNYKDSYELEEGVFVVAQYYPGTESRIYLKGLGDKAMQRVVAKYESRYKKKILMYTPNIQH